MTNRFDKILREQYLQDCLKEYYIAREFYKSRSGYLKARKNEIAMHKNNWKIEDEAI